MAAVLIAVSCGKGLDTNAAGDHGGTTYLYVASSNGTIDTYRMDRSTGALSFVRTWDDAYGLSDLESIDVHPSRNLLVAGFTNNSLSTNRSILTEIDPASGTLAERLFTSVITGQVVFRVLFHPFLDEFISGDSTGSGSSTGVRVVKWSANWGYTQATLSMGTPGGTPTGLQYTPDGAFIYASIQASAAGKVAASDAAGNLSGMSDVAPLTQLATLRARNFVYRMTQTTLDQGISIVASGAPSATGISYSSPITAHKAATLDPQGRFLFIGGNNGGGTGEIHSYVLDSNGDTPNGQTFSSVAAPVALSSLKVDPTGQFLVASSITMSSVTVYSIQAGGALTQLSQVTPPSFNPTSLAFYSAPEGL
jgi:6-phosphogluconolactonase (cycloisomerase 2 family)